MRTKKLTTYQQFVDAGRPYLPRFSGYELLLPNFEINCDSLGRSDLKNVRRLAIVTVPIVNWFGFTAVYSGVLSRLGWRERWLYWRVRRVYSDLMDDTFTLYRQTWHSLTWEERHHVATNFSKAVNSGKIPDTASGPVKHWSRFVLHV